jgi:hypothetical protein
LPTHPLGQPVAFLLFFAASLCLLGLVLIAPATVFPEISK